ncbi:MAG: dihydroorotate dehydrogenase [Gemmatimonadales bacterium]|nr:MAG: dihydroorotate dehydrogenase [Gemmatimonadales bacterium]
MNPPPDVLEQTLFGARFTSPVLLAAGTCGFGEAIIEVMDLAQLGGLVTKSVTVEPRWGNPAPRVAEFPAGMVNSIGLANPGVEAVRREKLPWIRDHLQDVRVFVSVAGHTPGEYADVVGRLDDLDGFLGFELNLSCPNDSRRGGLPFAFDPDALASVVADVRRITERPLLVKLAPNTPDLGPAVRAAEESGADGLTLVNTLPGLVLDPRTRRAALGAGAGGMSGPALRAVGVHATWRASRLTALPLVGVGGVASGEDAVQYFLAGASLVQIGTASFWDPRSAGRVSDEIRRFARSQGVRSLREWVGTARVGPDAGTEGPAGAAPAASPAPAVQS